MLHHSPESPLKRGNRNLREWLRMIHEHYRPHREHVGTAAILCDLVAELTALLKDRAKDKRTIAVLLKKVGRRHVWKAKATD